MPIPEQLIALHRAAQKGIETRVKVAEALQWCDPSFKRARAILRLAMIELGLTSRPSATTASINSTVTFYLQDKIPPNAVMSTEAFRPDISDIERKLKLRAEYESKLINGRPVESATDARPLDSYRRMARQPKNIADVATDPATAGQRLEIAAHPTFVAPKSSTRKLIIRRDATALVVLDRITASQLLALLNADDRTEAFVVDIAGTGVGRLTYRAVMLAVAADDGGISASILLRK